MGKKAGCIWIFFFVCHLAGFGQRDVQQLFGELSALKDVNRINVGSISMKLAGFFTETMGVESIEVLELTRCTAEVKEHFSRAFGSVKDKAFETLVTASENGNRTKVMLRIRDDIIHELVVLSSGENPAMIRIKGHIKQSDVEQLIREHQK
ncbi:MAG: DUF4252 domain-containing protein [Tannerellaceae bacterium]|jgi:hypothetical protein|nr:DUF4252 domain-containing protein [Tannerellaceae bacterium]